MQLRHAPSPALEVLSLSAENDDFAKLLLPLMSDRRVLDIGCVNHTFFPTPGRRRDSSFFRIEEVAAEVLGIDNADHEVSLARQYGHNIVHGDAETFIADNPFDVVHAGDIIEHLNNPGLFLNCCHTNLLEDGILIITTPNTYSLANGYHAITRLTNDPVVHPQHTFYFTPKTLHELVSRHGFTPVYFKTMEFNTRERTRMSRFLLRVNSMVTHVLPQFKRTLVGVFKKQGALRG